MFVHPVGTPLRACPTGVLVLPLYGGRPQNTTALSKTPEEWFHPWGADKPPTRVYKTVGNLPIKADVYRPDDGVVRPVEVWIPLRTIELTGLSRASTPRLAA